ncbi:MAG: chemotaxis protein CheW [Bacteriovoracaceae bacterium]|jgi:purine-binding chemotaxis protein CheW|nr:chemotaxis protein CheW [Bacteriovoracaceae bacterium]
MEVVEENNLNLDYVQLCGFKIGDGFYAVPVLEVQEVVRPQKITQVPMAPDYIEGLINLRGQVVTSINLRTLFKLKGDDPEEFMNVIVRSRGSLYALVVDEILDVMDVPNKAFEETPDTLDNNLRKYIEGVYKLKDKLLISLSIEKLINVEE